MKNIVEKSGRYIVFAVMPIFCGCITVNHHKTLSEELVDCFGSMENAINQPWTFCPTMPIPGQEYRRVKLTNTQKTKVLSAVKDCIRPDSIEQKPQQCYAPFGFFYVVSIGPGFDDLTVPTFEIDFVGAGFLTDFVPTTPEGVFEVYSTIKWLLSGMPDMPEYSKDECDIVPSEEKKEVKTPER